MLVVIAEGAESHVAAAAEEPADVAGKVVVIDDEFRRPVGAILNIVLMGEADSAAVVLSVKEGEVIGECEMVSGEHVTESSSTFAGGMGVVVYGAEVVEGGCCRP